jgi:beta-mannosidase
VVPGRWPLAADSAVRTVWFRRRFDVSPEGGRAILVFDGVNYFSDFWLNGHYLGSHEGYLGRIRLDASGLLQESNVLVVKVVAPHDVLGEEDQMNQLKHHFVGALGRWDMNDPESKPAGVWGGVRLELQGATGIDRARLTYNIPKLPNPSERDAVVAVDAILSVRTETPPGADTQSVVLRWSLAPIGFEGAVQSGESGPFAVHGMRDLSLAIPIEARLWWTWDLGQPRLYDVTIELVSGDTLLDRRAWRTGFRDLALGEGWDLRLNGVSLYQRGANYLSDLDLSSMTAERYAADAALFRAGNLNTVHPFCLVEGDGLYAACDAVGLIVYQDFPLWLMAATSSDLVRRALLQFDEMLDRLGGSPSVAIWNFGSQPSVANVDKLCTALVRYARVQDPSRISHLGNSAVAYEAHDDVHPVSSFFWDEASAVRFEEKYDWRRDSHMYPGWYFGEIEAIRGLPEHHFSLVTEFGGQALPNRDNLGQFMTTDGPIDWRTIARRCGQPGLLQRHNPEARDVGALIDSSQAHQAELLRHHTEFIRARKGRPGRGLHVFAFNDCWPSVTWSMIDYDRVPKPSFAAVAIAMAPVQAFWSLYRQGLATGRSLVPFVLVNDTAEALTDLTLRVEIEAAGRVVFVADAGVASLGMDHAVDVPIEVDIQEPFEAGELRVELRAADGALLAWNHYRFVCR